jgi:uncharacterized protein with beta-barrel porin domain
MSVDKTKISSLWAIVLASFSSQALAFFPDVASMFEAIRPTAAVTAPELNTLIIAIDALPTPEQKFDALQTLIPSADGSLRAASEGPMSQMYAVVNDRLIRVAAESGVSSGDDAKTTLHSKLEKNAESSAKTENAKDEQSQPQAEVSKEPQIPEAISKGAWIQLLGNNSGQSERDFVPGYDADVAGILIGRDMLFDQLIVGLAGGYTYADVDSRGPSGSFLDIKRYQGTLYAGFNFVCPFYVHAAFTIARNDYDNDRKILVPPVGGVPFVRIAWSEFSAWETDAYLETGYIWQKGNFRAIPKIMLAYSHFDFEGYVEQDAFGLDLYVNYDDMDFLPLGAGFKFEYQNKFEKAYVVPEMHAYIFHDFINDKQSAAALFTAGGFAFLSQGAEPDATSFEVGAGIAVHSYKNTGVTIQYDYVGRDDYHRHQAFIKVRHEWA